jgi:asparagine N-glycosylation enzyme membrane subunit Stt3
LKIVIVLILLVIVASLASALFHLVKDREKTAKTARALTWRIGLSLGLFFFLLIAFGRGWIQPHSFSGPIQQSTSKESTPKP